MSAILPRTNGPRKLHDRMVRHRYIAVTYLARLGDVALLLPLRNYGWNWSACAAVADPGRPRHTARFHLQPLDPAEQPRR